MNLVTFSWILVAKMVLYPSKFILLQSSYIKSPVKLRIFVSSVHKHSSKTLLVHLCAFLQTLILLFYFWCWSEVCILLCSICNSVSKSPEDSRFSEHHPAFWKLLVILQTRLLGSLFTAFMICLSSTTVVFSADQVVVGCWCRWWFSNSWFLHALCFFYSSNWLPLFF